MFPIVLLFCLLPVLLFFCKTHQQRWEPSGTSSGIARWCLLQAFSSWGQNEIEIPRSNFRDGVIALATDLHVLLISKNMRTSGCWPAWLDEQLEVWWIPGWGKQKMCHWHSSKLWLQWTKLSYVALCLLTPKINQGRPTYIRACFEMHLLNAVLIWQTAVGKQTSTEKPLYYMVWIRSCGMAGGDWKQASVFFWIEGGWQWARAYGLGRSSGLHQMEWRNVWGFSWRLMPLSVRL